MAHSRLHRIWRGMRATLPVGMSVIPFGVAYGAVAAQRLAFWQVELMSLTVFAGTAQFIAASMLAQGSAYWPVLVTGILINVRLLLLSAALVPHVRRIPRILHPAVAQLLTDESFAVSMAEYERRPSDPLFFIGSGLTIYAVWQIGTVAGLIFGNRLPSGLGLEYALPGSLICLLFMLVRDRHAAAIALLAGALALALRPLISPAYATLVATLLAATLGVLWKRWRSRC